MFAPVDIGPALDRATAALNAPRLNAAIESTSKRGKLVERSSASLHRDGTLWTVRLQAPPTAQVDRVDTMYRVGPERIEGWNRLWNERLSLAIPTKARSGPASARLALAAPLTLEAELLTSPTMRKSVFDGFRMVKGWQRNGNVWRAKRNGETVEVRFDGAGRWTGYSAAGKDQQIRLAVSYPANVLAFVPPATARAVRAFAAAPALPKGADENLLRSILAAHKHFRGSVISSNTNLTVTDRRVGEKRPDLTWQWSNGLVTATQNGKTKSAKSSLRDVVATLGGLTGKGPDAYIRDLTLGRIPFANILSPGAKVKQIGQITTNGVLCDILGVESGNRRITLFVRRSDHLVASATVEALDKKGTVMRTLRTYRYAKA